MNTYAPEPFEDQVNTESRPKLPTAPSALQLQKHGEVKRGFDFLITTPGKIRRGVCRHGDQLRGFTDYNIKLFRSDDKEWALYVEWVDLEGVGHRVVFPHAVIAGVLQRANSIIAQGRSERAKNAAMTRKQKGIVPFQKRSPQEQG
jgi:hypothetical protein